MSGLSRTGSPAFKKKFCLSIMNNFIFKFGRQNKTSNPLQIHRLQVIISSYFKYKFGLSVCLYPINVKTAEPIGPKFFVGHLGPPGKVYE